MRRFSGEVASERPGEAPAEAVFQRMVNRARKARIPEGDLQEGAPHPEMSFLAATLPSTWDGLIPPITISGRHEAIDRYLARNYWIDHSGISTILDVGCGFPPVPTVELAESFAAVG